MKSKYSPNKTLEERKAFWFNDLDQRRCSTCEQFKSPDQFSRDKNGPAESGRSYACKDCVRLSHKAVYQNKERYTKKKARDRENYYLRVYGITKDRKAEMIQEQQGCAICGVNHKHMHVDHNHSTGKIRGVLCTNCNRGIGHLQENIMILQKAITYLQAHNEDAVIVSEVSGQ